MSVVEPARYSVVYRRAYWRVYDAVTGAVLSQHYYLYQTAARDAARLNDGLKPSRGDRIHSTGSGRVMSTSKNLRRDP